MLIDYVKLTLKCVHLLVTGEEMNNSLWDILLAEVERCIYRSRSLHFNETKDTVHSFYSYLRF